MNPLIDSLKVWANVKFSRLCYLSNYSCRYMAVCCSIKSLVRASHERSWQMNDIFLNRSFFFDAFYLLLVYFRNYRIIKCALKPFRWIALEISVSFPSSETRDENTVRPNIDSVFAYGSQYATVYN